MVYSTPLQFNDALINWEVCDLMDSIPVKDMSQQFVETLVLIRQNFYRQTTVPIPLNQFGVLCILAAEGSLSITDISRGLNISKQQMTTVIDKLVKSRLVEKTADLNDRRRFVITMTPSGQATLDKQNEIVRKRFIKQSRKLTKEENQQLAAATQTYKQLISKMFA